MTHAELISAEQPQETTAPAKASLLGLWVDHDTLCAPHVPAIREVLEGKRYRYKVQLQQATFVFHHGCLMAQVVHDGMIRALPPFSLDEAGQPFLYAPGEHQMNWVDEFLALPKGVLLMYFSLLKNAFYGAPLTCKRQNPDTGVLLSVPVPQSLLESLNEVDWQTA